MVVDDSPVPVSPTRVTSLTPRTSFFVAAKLLFAFLGFSALVTEVAVLVERNQFESGNFFSYFTVEANTLAVISLVLSALAMVVGRTGPGLEFFRGAAAFCMTTTLLIFIVLLSGYSADTLTAVPWDNTVLHYLMPIVVILDWLTASKVAAIPVRRWVLWLILPLAYFVYSLIRGPIVDWYPYPFMDASLHGYGSIAVTALILAVVLAVVAGVVATAARLTPHTAA